MLNYYTSFVYTDVEICAKNTGGSWAAHVYMNTVLHFTMYHTEQCIYSYHDWGFIWINCVALLSILSHPSLEYLTVNAQVE